jgi:hypothetical protein
MGLTDPFQPRLGVKAINQERVDTERIEEIQAKLTELEGERSEEPNRTKKGNITRKMNILKKELEEAEFLLSGLAVKCPFLGWYGRSWAKMGQNGPKWDGVRLGLLSVRDIPRSKSESTGIA